MSQVAIVLWWWILVAVIGLLAWPLAFRLLRFLPDRGYSAARPIGLLLSTYFWWLLGSLGFLTTSSGSIIIALLLMGALAGWFYTSRRSTDSATPLAWLRQNLTYVAIYELVFLVAFAGWAWFRAHCPGINHTEKPMEFAFLNGILRSSSFPPNDPWLAGYSISYYYMGYVMMALLTRLSGTAPGIAYNVTHALWFAFFAAGAFGAAYNLIAANKQPNPQSATRNRHHAIIYGLLAAVMLVVMGNLAGVLELAHQNGVGSAEFWQWLDIAELAGPPTSNGGLTPQRGGWWWWRASRVINDYTLDGNSQHNGGTTVIDEFPQFSFILGDMHPHVLGLPFSLLAILLAFNLYSANLRLAPTFHLPLSTFLLYALALGALGFLNTWDYPIYITLVVVAYGLRRWHEEGLTNRVLLEMLGLGAAIGITGILLYLPFYLSFESQARGLFPNLFYGTRFSQLFVMFGPFLVIGGCFIAALARRLPRRTWLEAAQWTAIIIPGCIILMALIGIVSPQGRAYLQLWQQDQPIPGLAPGANDVVISRLVGRLTGAPTLTPRVDGSTILVPGSGPWTPLILTFTIILIILLWRRSFGRAVNQSPDHPVTQSPAHPVTLSPRHFALLLYALGALIVLGIEFVFLADAFGGTRMNTIFKFYYQVWALWSIASAYGAYYVIDHANSGQGSIARTVQAGLMAVMILAGLVYPLMAIPSRLEQKDLTLDGAAYLAQHSPDEYAAIQWLNANVPGAPIILEAPGGSFRAETSRVSGYTGLPTLIGWDGHETQWRKDFGGKLAQLQNDVAEIYTSRNIERTLSLLNQYNVTYIYVGPREQAQYSPPAAKFDAIAERVFQQGSVTIYKIRRQ